MREREREMGWRRAAAGEVGVGRRRVGLPEKREGRMGRGSLGCFCF